MDLEEQLEKIQSHHDLGLFVQALARDFKNDPGDWENDSLSAFLEAVAAWIQDMDGFFHMKGESTPEQPNWKTMGDILMAAKSYE